MNQWDKNTFIYECAMRGFQGRLANPAQQASIASSVRDAEQLWIELQDWQQQQNDQNDQNDQNED